MSNRDDSLWTDTRRRLAADLYQIEKALSFTYSTAIDLLGSYDHEAESAHSDIAQIAHALRELINTLPYYIGNDVEMPKPTQAQEERAIRNLIRQIESNDLCDYTEEPDGGEIKISSELAIACSEYYKARAKGHRNVQIKDSASVLGSVHLDNAALTPWTLARDFFMNHAHLNRSFDLKPPSREEILVHLERIEMSLTSRLGRFFEAKEQLSFVLKKANAQNDDGSFAIPSEEDVLDALSLLNDRTLKGLFYTTLENPEWVVLLDKNKVFNSVVGLVGENGNWPESVYLQRIAAEKPNEVARILERLAPKINYRGYQSAMRILEVLPAQYGNQLVPRICEWMKKPEAPNSFWDTQVNTSVIAKLLNSEETYKNGRKLACEYFKPRYAEDYGSIRAAAYYYDYAQCFNDVWETLKQDDRKQVPEWLLGSYFQLKSSNGLPAKRTDLYIPSIDDAMLAEGDGASIEIVLTQKLVLALKDYAQNDLERLKEALRSKKPIVKRCAIHALYEVIGEAEQNPNELISFAQDVLVSDALYDSELDTEVQMLMQRVGCMMDSECLKALTDRIGEANVHLAETYHDRLSGIVEDEGELDNLVAQRIMRWQHRRLTLLSNVDLPETAKRLLGELDDEFGKQEYSIKPVRTRTITGPNSPISEGQMKEMKTDDLLAHLKQWHPSKDDRWELISHDGQARVLKEVVKSDPFGFAGKLDELKKLRPIYVRHIIDGWSELISDRQKIPTGDFIELCAWASGFDDSEALEPDGDAGDDDNSYRNLVYSSVSAIVDALGLEGSGEQFAEHSGAMLHVLSNALSSKEPDEEYEEMYGGDNMDPLELAINTIRPLAIMGLSRWVFQFPDSPLVDSALDMLLGVSPSVSHSVADAGAFGDAIRWIVPRKELWAERHRSVFFGEDKPNEYQQIVLATLLFYFQESSAMLEYLLPAILAAIVSGYTETIVGPHSISKSCSQSIGEWLYEGAALGHIEIEGDLLVKWEESVQVDLIWDAVDHTCIALSHTEAPASDVVNNVGLLWDRCYKLYGVSDETSETAFHSISNLARSGWFAEDWWGLRMRDVSKGGCKDHSLTILHEELLSLSRNRPELAFELFEAHVDNSIVTGSSFYIRKELAVPILAHAIGFENPDVVNHAKRCMDKLGSLGMIDLDKEIRDFKDEQNTV